MRRPDGPYCLHCGGYDHTCLEGARCRLGQIRRRIERLLAAEFAIERAGRDLAAIRMLAHLKLEDLMPPDVLMALDVAGEVNGVHPEEREHLSGLAYGLFHSDEERPQPAGAL